MQQDSSDLAAEIKRGLLLNIFINSNFHSWKARIQVAERTKAPLSSSKQEVGAQIQPKALFYFDFFQEILWLSAKSCEGQILEDENLWLKLQLVFRCTYGLLAASLENFIYFYLIKIKNLSHSKPYFGLF